MPELLSLLFVDFESPDHLLSASDACFPKLLFVSDAGVVPPGSPPLLSEVGPSKSELDQAVLLSEFEKSLPKRDVLENVISNTTETDLAGAELGKK